MMDDRMHAAMTEALQANAPRYFAIYGHAHDEWFVDWGMEFDDPPSAVVWSDSGARWEGDSACGLVSLRSRIGEARLVWLNDLRQSGGAVET